MSAVATVAVAYLAITLSVALLALWAWHLDVYSDDRRRSARVVCLSPVWPLLVVWLVWHVLAAVWHDAWDAQ